MEKEQTLLTLLEDKRQLLLKMEEATSEMLSCDAMEIPDHIALRQELFDQVVALDGRIAAAAAAMGPAAEEAVQNRCGRDGLAPPLDALFDQAMAAKAVAMRMQAQDDSIRARIADEREKAAQKLQELNRSSATVARQYRMAAQTSMGNQLPGTGGAGTNI